MPRTKAMTESEAEAASGALLSGLGWSPLNLATLGLLALALLLVVSGPRQATTA